MKKFFTFLMLLLIIGGVGTVFYLGWIQRHLGANDYGVVFTKSGGYDENLLKPGRFAWRWEALIPANFTVHVFHLEPQNSRVSLKGELPSGKLYGNFFDGQPDFSYDVTLSLNYRLKPEALPLLVREASVTPQGLMEWYKEREDAALVEAVRILKGEMEESDLPWAPEDPLGRLGKELIEGLNAAFPNLHFIRTTVVSLKLPDGELYRRAREAYFSLMDSKKELNIRALEGSVSQTTEQAARLEVLKGYGELLTSYPILLDFLRLRPEMAEEVPFGTNGEE